MEIIIFLIILVLLSGITFFIIQLPDAPSNRELQEELWRKLDNLIDNVKDDNERSRENHKKFMESLDETTLKLKRLDDPEELYCIECGSEDLAYVDHYANGYQYKCRVCGHLSIFQSNATDE